MPYEVRFSSVARKDVLRLSPRLKKKLKEILLGQISVDPFSGKKLVGDLEGFFSVRLAFKDRIVYSIDAAHRVAYIHRARTHYGD